LAVTALRDPLACNASSADLENPKKPRVRRLPQKGQSPYRDWYGGVVDDLTRLSRLSRPLVGERSGLC